MKLLKMLPSLLLRLPIFKRRYYKMSLILFLLQS